MVLPSSPSGCPTVLQQPTPNTPKMDFLIQSACSFLPSPLAPYAANFLRSFQNGGEGDSHGPVLDFLKAQTPLLVSLIGIYFAATSMLRTLRVAFRSTLFVAKYGSVLALVAIIYQAFTSSDPAKSLQSSLSTIVHSASALGGLGGSALYWLSMIVGGETGENVRKLASYVFSTSAEEKKSRGGGPASRTRSSKKANNKKKPLGPLAGLFNSAPNANNGDASNAGGDVVQDFLAKVVGGAGGETVDQLKTLLSGGGNLQDMLGALAGAVGGQNEDGR